MLFYETTIYGVSSMKNVCLFCCLISIFLVFSCKARKNSINTASSSVLSREVPLNSEADFNIQRASEAVKICFEQSAREVAAQMDYGKEFRVFSCEIESTETWLDCPGCDIGTFQVSCKSKARDDAALNVRTFEFSADSLILNDPKYEAERGPWVHVTNNTYNSLDYDSAEKEFQLSSLTPLIHHRLKAAHPEPEYRFTTVNEGYDNWGRPINERIKRVELTLKEPKNGTTEASYFVDDDEENPTGQRTIAKINSVAYKNCLLSKIPELTKNK